MEFGIDNVKDVIRFCSRIVCEAKEELGRVDGKAGDGDLGISMQKGAEALLAVVDSYQSSNIGEFFFKCAMALNKAAPSTMGTLLCAGFMQTGRKFADCTGMDGDDIMEIPGYFAEAIICRGKAEEGNRTVLDALLPMCRAFHSVKERRGSIAEALREGREAAAEGVEKTRGLIPKVGRSKWMPENAAGEADGGALLCGILADALAEKYC